MLTLEPPIYTTQSTPKGLTVFRDHEDPDQFYALPGRPAIAVASGKPVFDLYKYRRDLTDNPALDPTRARGAGLCDFDVEVPFDPAPIAADIAAQSGRPHARVAAVPFTRCEARAIVAKPDGDRLIEDLVEIHAAPAAAPYHTTFSLALTAEGATLVEQAARGGALPVGVAYEARFLALAPSLHARVTMSYGRMYDHYSASVGFSYYVKVGLDFDLQKLIDDGAVKIEITKFSDAADADRQQQAVMKLVQARIQGDFFRSAIPSDDGGGAGEALGGFLGQLLGSKVTSSTALFVLKARADVVREDKDFVLTFDGRSAIELAHTMAGGLSALTPDGAVLGIHDIDLDDPFFSELRVDVGSAIDWDALADLVEADLEIVRGDVRQGFAVRRDAPGPFVFRAPLTRPDDDLYQYTVDFHFDPDRGAGPPAISASAQASRRRALVIDPLANFRYRRVRFRLGPNDFAVAPRIHLRVRVPSDAGDDRARVELTLEAQTPEARFRMHAPASEPPIDVVIDTAWEDAQGARHDLDTGIPVEGDDFVVSGPFPDSLDVLVQPVADWAHTTSMLVELRYRDGDREVDRQLTFSAAQKGSQRVSFPVRDGGPRTYDWRQTVAGDDGSSQTDWATSDRALLVASALPPKTSAPLQIAWLGAAGDALALRVDLWAETESGEQQVSALLRPSEEKTIDVPTDGDGQLKYRYEVRKIGAGGDAQLIKSGEGSGAILVVQAG